MTDEPSAGVRTPTPALPLRIVLETLNEWLRLNASQITAAILVFAVQPGLELPPLILRLFSS